MKLAEQQVRLLSGVGVRVAPYIPARHSISLSNVMIDTPPGQTGPVIQINEPPVPPPNAATANVGDGFAEAFAKMVRPSAQRQFELMCMDAEFRRKVITAMRTVLPMELYGLEHEIARVVLTAARDELERRGT